MPPSTPNKSGIIRKPAFSCTRWAKAALGRPRSAAVRALSVASSTVFTPLWSGRSRNRRCPPLSTTAIVGSRLIFAPAARLAAAILCASSSVRAGFIRTRRLLAVGWVERSETHHFDYTHSVRWVSLRSTHPTADTNPRHLRVDSRRRNELPARPDDGVLRALLEDVRDAPGGARQRHQPAGRLM